MMLVRLGKESKGRLNQCDRRGNVVQDMIKEGLLEMILEQLKLE